MNYSKKQIAELQKLTKKELIKRLERASFTVLDYQNALERECTDHKVTKKLLQDFQISCHLLQLKHNPDYVKNVAREVELNTNILETPNFAMPF